MKIDNEKILRIYLRSFNIQSMYNYKTGQSLGILYTMMPFLESRNKKEVTKYFDYYYINPFMSTIIIGILMAVIDNDMEISDYKTSTMALSNIGDNLFNYLLIPLFSVLSINLVAFNNYIGIYIFLILFPIIYILFSFYGLKLSYKYSNDLFKKFNIKLFDKTISIMSAIILGAITIYGSLLTLNLSFNKNISLFEDILSQEKNITLINVNDLLNNIIPAFIPIFFVLLFVVLKKKFKIKDTYIVVSIVLLSFIFGYLNIFNVNIFNSIF